MCVRKRRNTGSTARISALDAPMALNWLAAAQVALLLILTDNSAALFSYSGIRGAQACPGIFRQKV